jgi:hypothetical protein
MTIAAQSLGEVLYLIGVTDLAGIPFVHHPLVGLVTGLTLSSQVGALGVQALLGGADVAG